MGKIVDAIKAGHGEVAEMVLKSIQEAETEEGGSCVETSSAARAHGGRAVPWIVPAPVESAADQTLREQPEAAGPLAALSPIPGRWQVRELPLHIQDSGPLLSAKPAQTGAVEQYRFVATRIIHHPSAPATIAVSSPGVGDGKTTTAVNLAATLAQASDQNVLLIDGDMRSSMVHACLHVPGSPGLIDVLAGRCSPQEAIFQVAQIPNLCVLPAGSAEGNPTELLGSSRWPALLKTLRLHFSRMIVDCPPVEAVADYDLLATECNSAILVVRPDRTNRFLCARAIEKTRKKLLGVLLNCAADKGLPREFASYYQRSRGEKTRI